MINPIKKHPWIFLLFLFLFSVTAWIFFIVLAVRNPPEQIEPDRFYDTSHFLNSHA